MKDDKQNDRQGVALSDDEENWAPKRIWLQKGVGEGGSHTWCEDSQEPECEEASYIREDFTGTLSADYLSGHQDGLDWASKMANACDPRTGDWLYDDPEKLSEAIRKGPDLAGISSASSSRVEVEIPEGYALVPKSAMVRLLCLIDPAPVEVDGKTMAFKNPMAADILTKISAEVRSLLAAAKAPNGDQS